MVDKIIKYLERLNLPVIDLEVLEILDGHVVVSNNGQVLQISRKSLLFTDRKT